MKNILIALLLTFSLNSYAVDESSLRIKVKCVDGYKFAVVWTTKSNSSPMIVQIFGSTKIMYPPHPIKCK